MCDQVGVALAPYRYCYLCFGRFGSATQVTLLMLAYHPTLPEEVVRRVLGRHCDDVAVSDIYRTVQALVEEEAARSQAEQWVTALPECCIHTRNAVIYRTVYLGQQGETVGTVLLAGPTGCATRSVQGAHATTETRKRMYEKKTTKEPRASGEEQDHAHARTRAVAVIRDNWSNGPGIWRVSC